MTTSEIVLLIVIALLLIAVAWLGATKDSLESQMRGEIENLKVKLFNQGDLLSLPGTETDPHEGMTGEYQESDNKPINPEF